LSDTQGILLARVVDDRGEPKVGVTASSFALASAGASGPHFLGDNKQAVPMANATSASGWVVYFGVAPGVAQLGTAANANVPLDMPVSTIAARTVTIATIKATDGAQVLPTNVSFKNQIMPIFRNVSQGGRGCVACHREDKIGATVGNLVLNVETGEV